VFSQPHFESFTSTGCTETTITVAFYELQKNFILRAIKVMILQDVICFGGEEEEGEGEL
jgi:hypothetical protein